MDSKDKVTPNVFIVHILLVNPTQLCIISFILNTLPALLFMGQNLQEF